MIYRLLLKENTKELSNCPEGSLVINNQPKCTCFYKWHNRKQVGISSDIELVISLARKRFLKKNKKRIEYEHNLIKEMIQILSEDKSLSRVNKFIDEIIATKLNIQHVKWTPQQIAANVKQSENPYKREELRYATNGGIMVRNMAEKMWGDLYELLGIPYQYEKAFRLDVTELTGVTGTTEYNGRFYKTYYPDFTLFMADGSIIIHEHLGFIHYPEYRDKQGEKFIAYTLNGLVTHETFLVTYPKDAKNSSSFRELLETYVLPRV